LGPFYCATGFRKRVANTYLGRMFKAFDVWPPHQVYHRPHGPDWLHEVKYDGYPLRLERDGDRVRPITRGG
jgi:ATP-dependent DNA ligase